MKNWKNILLIIVAMGVAFSLHAQEEPSWKETLPRHDVQFGIGDPALLFLTVGEVRFETYNPHDFDYITADNWFNGEYVNTLALAAPSLNLEYRYRFAKWFWFGGAFSFTPIAKVWENHEKGYKFTCHTYHISIMPSVRFSWLNKKYITLYSGLSAGCLISTGGKFSPEENVAYQMTEVHFAGQLTAVGIQGGKNWYGFAEVGVGVQGFVKAGFGYKFQSKEKKSE